MHYLNMNETGFQVVILLDDGGKMPGRDTDESRTMTDSPIGELLSLRPWLGIVPKGEDEEVNHQYMSIGSFT